MNQNLKQLAAQGIQGDTQLAHLTPGEVVVPKEVAQANPDLIAKFKNSAKLMGINAANTTVGRENFINPKTGLPMFATQDDHAAYAAWIQTPGAKEYATYIDAQKAATPAPATPVGPAPAPSPAPSPVAPSPTPSPAASPAVPARPTTPSPATTPATDYSSQITNIYRNAFGRDPNAEGLKYWNEQANKGGGLDKIYSHLVGGGANNGEVIKNAGLLYSDAIKAPTSNFTGNTTNNSTVDQWYQNVLGREPTAADKAKFDSYKDALNYRIATGDYEMANTIYTMFLRDNNIDPKTAMSMAQASQLKLGQTPPPPSSGGGGNTYTPELNRTVVGAEETIEGRINGLMATDANGNYTNPVVRQAAERALQAFAGRGLLNSSMSQQAAQEAAISKAIEIAGPDAKTYFEQGRANQDAKNLFARDETQYGYDLGRIAAQGDQTIRSQNNQNSFTAGQNQLQRDWTTSERVNTQTWNSGESAANRASQLQIAQKQMETTLQTANLSANTQKEIAEINRLAAQSANLSSASMSMLTNYNNSVFQILTSDLDAAAKESAINRLSFGLRSGIQLQGSINGDMNMTQLMASLFPDIRANTTTLKPGEQYPGSGPVVHTYYPDGKVPTAPTFGIGT